MSTSSAELPARMSGGTRLALANATMNDCVPAPVSVFPSPVRSRVLAALGCFALFAGLPEALPAQNDQPGATHVFITYRCSAVDRPAFRKVLEDVETPRFEQWKQDGVMQDYVLVFNCFVDENTWDATLMLRFERYAQTKRWHEVEKEFPGGLGSQALAYATPCTTYLADLEFTNGGPAPDREQSLFVLIPYTYST